MKNVHIISTDKPSRLYLTTKEYVLENEYSLSTDECQNKNIYITSDEEIKEGDWVYSIRGFVAKFPNFENSYIKECKKIILTTDQDLIKDGVQAIDDEFLEWFVKNPSCEFVELKKGFEDGSSYGYNFLDYKIIIPKEEPKQRLERYSERFDNKDNEIGNPETWGKRMVKEELDYTALLKPVGTWQENYLEEYFLDKIKEVLQFGNDAQAIRFMEKYFEAKQEQDEK